jgi:hypothetical protein
MLHRIAEVSLRSPKEQVEAGGGAGASYTAPSAQNTTITTDKTAENGSAAILASGLPVNVDVLASPNPGFVGSNVTLTANVRSLYGGVQVQPTGSVDFSLPNPGDGASHEDLGTGRAAFQWDRDPDRAGQRDQLRSQPIHDPGEL